MRLLICTAVVVWAGVSSADEPKKDEEQTQGKVATLQAQAIKKATETYYTQQLEWPKKLEDVASLLQDGKKGLIDPWGKEFKFRIADSKQADGTLVERPYVWTERVVGKETKVYGTKPPEEKKDKKGEKKEDKQQP